MKLAADNLQTLVLPDIDHWVAEQAPEELVAALTAFLAPPGRRTTPGRRLPGSTPCFGSRCGVV